MNSTILKPPSASELRFNDVLITRLKIFSDKNRDYGTSFDVDGVIGVVVRLGDKLKRLKTLSENKFQIIVKEEGLKELFLDIANYCDIGIMLLEDADEEKEKTDCNDHEQKFLQQGKDDTGKPACSCGTCSAAGK